MATIILFVPATEGETITVPSIIADGPGSDLKGTIASAIKIA